MNDLKQNKQMCIFLSDIDGCNSVAPGCLGSHNYSWTKGNALEWWWVKLLIRTNILKHLWVHGHKKEVVGFVEFSQ